MLPPLFGDTNFNIVHDSVVSTTKFIVARVAGTEVFHNLNECLRLRKIEDILDEINELYWT